MKVGAVSQQEDGTNYITTCYWKRSNSVTTFITDELMNIRTSWSVSHTWEQWKDIHAYIEFISVNKNIDLPSLPKSHLVMTTLLIDDRMNALNRYLKQYRLSLRYVQGLMQYDQIISSYEVSKFFGIATHIRKEKCIALFEVVRNRRCFMYAAAKWSKGQGNCFPQLRPRMKSKW